MASIKHQRHEARERAERFAAALGADPVALAEVKADEAAALNGRCPPADSDDVIERRLRDLQR